jgi:uncharacterized protein (AIM24 family)
LDVREHQFLAPTDSLGYSFERFRATEGDALVWLHGHGNVFLVNLGEGEQLDVEAGAWLYKDPTVSLEAVTMGLKTGIMGGGGKLTWNRFTGPGRLAIQTLFIAPLEGEGATGQNAQAATAGGLAGALIGGLTRG